MVRTVPMAMTGELFLAEAWEHDRVWDKSERMSDIRKVRTAIQDEEAQESETSQSPSNTLVGEGGLSSQREGCKADVRNVFKRTASQQSASHSPQSCEWKARFKCKLPVAFFDSISPA